MRDMYRVLVEAGWRQVVADLLTLIAICVVLYGATVAAGLLQ